MILTEEVRSVKRSHDFEQNTFSIKASAKAFMVLSDKIYTNKIKAVIRELCCNAHDSHVDAKNSEGFEVHLPTSLEPWFSVKDYGTGLSHEDCMSLYTTYFDSTKTNTNEQIGCLGIGSKSFFCYCESAVIESRFNGVKRIYTAYKDEENIPQFALLTQEETSEPNGLEVRIDVPREDFDKFYTEAVQVLKYFDHLPKINLALVTENINRFKDSKIQSGTHYEIYPRAGYSNQSVAIMGNVAYDIPRGVHHLYDTCFFCVKFGLGEVDFTPGRESLELNLKTTNALKSKIELTKVEIAKDTILEINKCKTLYEARIKFLNIEDGIVSKCVQNLKWKECRLDERTFIVKPTIRMFDRSYRGGSYVASYTNINSITLDKNGVKIFVGDLDKKIRHAIRSGTLRRCYLIREEDKSAIIEALGCDKSLFLDGSDLEEPPKAVRAKTQQILKFDTKVGWVQENRSIDGKEYYIRICRDKPISPKLISLNRTIADLGTLISVPEFYGVRNNLYQQVQFQKSKWVNLETFIKLELTKLANNYPYTTTESINLSKTHYEVFSLLSLPENHEVSKFVEKCKKYNKEYCKIKTLCGLLDQFEISYKKDKHLSDMYEEIMKKWPMLTFTSNYRHWYQYDIGRKKLSYISNYLQD